ncbi:ABC transporter ATP-binding protein [Sphingobacterium psychroaquaticum]|uniref:ABC transporter ATP-binding protein n=1 Tax=Sphingobacterium psychroaquaticum TaxID=561061 RepID=UPI0010698CDE|nr:ABC transporter ATP-binding protein [Sphingobacterium psychroaquaticum]QBQ42599.1 ABC transporter ATP-binding protein [Sphingobacterium psychroaquaticum]
MANQPSSCQYIPSDVQRNDVSLIHGESLSHVFEAKNNIVAVDKVNFAIEEGKITAIIGESGSGKSTLLKLIYGLLEPSMGEVRYKGWLVPTRKDKLIPGHDAMKLVSQGFDDLNLYAKVWDNIASQLPNTNLERKRSKTEETLEKLKISHLSQQRIADLSGGEKQRVAIARALINEPEVLLMDEPFNQVDAAFRDALQQDIRLIVEETGLTIILVSHDPSEVLAMADSLIVMKEAKILEQGSPDILYYTPQNSYTAQLLAKSNILTPREAATLGIDSMIKIAIHQEDIDYRIDAEATFWIKDIRFRGFYKELILTDGALNLHVINYPIEKIEKGTKVAITIKRHTAIQN